MGKGSFGEVKKAKIRATGKYVAIKHVENRKLTSYILRKILRELIILRKLTEMDKNVYTIKLVDIIFIGDESKDATDPMHKLAHIFIVTNLAAMDYKTMLDLSGTRPLADEGVKKILYDQLCALNFFHSANLVHRDIKPGNLLVSDNGEMLLCDFGLARGVPERSKLDSSLKSLQKKEYREVLNSTAEKRESREQEYKLNMANFLKENKAERRRLPR